MYRARSKNPMQGFTSYAEDHLYRKFRCATNGYFSLFASKKSSQEELR